MRFLLFFGSPRRRLPYALSELKNNYPKVKYSATKIVMNTKRIHHRKFGFKLMPIMQVSLTFYEFIILVTNNIAGLTIGNNVNLFLSVIPKMEKRTA